MCFLEMSGLTNLPIAKHAFQQVSSGLLQWQFDLDWQRLSYENDYYVFMQLGDGALMSDDDQDAGVGVNLVWTALDDIHDTLAYRQDGVITPLQVVSGPATVTVLADLATKTYEVSVNGLVIQTGIAFENLVNLDTIRFFSHVMTEEYFAGRCFDNLEIRLPTLGSRPGWVGLAVLARPAKSARNTLSKEHPGAAAALPAHTVTRKYYHAGGRAMALRTGGDPAQSGLYYLLADHLGSTTVTLKDTGSAVSKSGELRYKPWGETRASSGTTPANRHFTGQIEEAGAGLYFYNARWYDSALGPFVQADTLVPDPGNPLDWDRYAYVRNNPVRYTDPTGYKVASVDEGNGKCKNSLDCVYPEYHEKAGMLIRPPKHRPQLMIPTSMNNWAWENIPSSLGITAGASGQIGIFLEPGFAQEYQLALNWRSGEISLYKSSGPFVYGGSPSIIGGTIYIGSTVVYGASSGEILSGGAVYSGLTLAADGFLKAGASVVHGKGILSGPNIPASPFIDPESGIPVTYTSANINIIGINAGANGVDGGIITGTALTDSLIVLPFPFWPMITSTK